MRVYPLVLPIFYRLIIYRTSVGLSSMQMREHVLSFLIPNQDSGEFYIDISESMSIVNRKLYRQQGLWHVHGVCTYADVVSAGQKEGCPYTVAVSGAPRNWVTRNSLVKAFEAWKDQQKKAYEAAGSSLKPKWQDFKVYLNDNHRTNGNVIPVSGHMFGGTDSYIGNEWDYSKIVFTEEDAANPGQFLTHEPVLHILGSDNGNVSKGLINQYKLSRATVDQSSPHTSSSVALNLYTQSHDGISEQVEEITTNLKEDNDEPPYALDQYPGDGANGYEPLLYSFGSAGNTQNRKLSMNGFAAPNGLLEVQFLKNVTPETTNTGEFWLQLFVSHREAY